MLALASISSVLPGLIAGFISGKRGFLVGAVAGALGSFLYGVYIEGMQFHSGALKPNARTWTAVFIFPTIYAAGLIITSAVGGGAGQLLRSNNRWRGP
jgi:fructose-specific phosphotransferase system IIC component